MNELKKYPKKRDQADLSQLMFGKVSPSVPDFEIAVLGAVMLEKSAYDRVEDLLFPEVFYVEAHQLVFKAMKDLKAKHAPIDMITVVEQLRANEELDEAGGPYAIAKITNSVVSSANIEYHSAMILEKWRMRELIRNAGELLNKAYDDSCSSEDLLEEQERSLTAISMVGQKDNTQSIDDAVTETLMTIESRRQADSHITGIPSGYTEIDSITHGWQGTDLIILAARPSVGKTAFALNIGRNAAKNETKPVPVAIFSLEMSTPQLVERLLSAESGVPMDQVQNGQMDDSEFKKLTDKGLNSLTGSGIIIDDTPALTIQQLRTRARRLKRRKNIGLIIIDYLQLMGGESKDGRNREQEISNISRNLKALAKELKLPIIALSQLSREPEKRKGADQQPKLSDLRESGAIEQDADLVMFLYRPEYHGIESNEMGESTSGETHIIISKHRNGTLAVRDRAIKLRALLHIQKFVPWDGAASVPAALGPGRWRPVSVGMRMGGDDLPFD